MNEILGCKATDSRTGYAATDSRQAAFPNSVYEQLACNDPASKEYEKCQAWRQAVATEEQACIARWQFWIGTLLSTAGLAAIVITLRHTAESARAAVLAAAATAKSVDVQMRLERPLITAEKVITNPKLRHDLHVMFRNVGSRPAILLRSSICEVVGKYTFPPSPIYTNYESRNGTVLQADKTYPVMNFVGGTGLAEVHAGRERAHVWGCVVYKTQIGEIRRMGFAFSTQEVNALMMPLLDDGDGAVYLIWNVAGGDVYNYDEPYQEGENT